MMLMFLLIFGALLHPGACLFSQLDRLQQQQQLFSKQIAELTAQYAELKEIVKTHICADAMNEDMAGNNMTGGQVSSTCQKLFGPRLQDFDGPPGSLPRSPASRPGPTQRQRRPSIHGPPPSLYYQPPQTQLLRLKGNEVSALTTAVVEGNAGIVEQFLQRGLDPDFVPPGPTGESLLMMAASKQQAHVVQLLLNYHASVYKKDKQGYPAIVHALFQAGDTDVTEVLRLLLEANADTNILVGNLSPLTIAVSQGNAEAVKLFLEYGASPNFPEVGVRPIMVASVRKDPIKLMVLLLSYGADVDAQTKEGDTALMILLDSQDSNRHRIGPSVASFLVDTAGANVQIRNEAGKSARDIAIANGWSSDVISLL